MRRLAEIGVFLPVAAGLHVAAFGLAGGLAGGTGGAAGDGGANLVTLAAAPPQAAALVKQWQEPPETSLAPERPLPAGRDDQPRPPRVSEPPKRAPRPTLGSPVVAGRHPPDPPSPQAPAVALPELATVAVHPPPAPDVSTGRPARRPVAQAASVQLTPAPRLSQPKMEPLPKVGAPREPFAPEAIALDRSPRPVPRPEPVPDTAPRPASASPPVPAKRAEGVGGGAAAGRDAAAPDPGRQAALGASWAARIQARIARAHRVPPALQRRGTSGRSVVRIVVGRDGRVISVAVVKSAGAAALDRAALQSVRRAGRLPAAPADFARPQMRFDVPLVFRVD